MEPHYKSDNLVQECSHPIATNAIKNLRLLLIKAPKSCFLLSLNDSIFTLNFDNEICHFYALVTLAQKVTTLTLEVREKIFLT